MPISRKEFLKRFKQFDKNRENKHQPKIFVYKNIPNGEIATRQVMFISEPIFSPKADLDVQYRIIEHPIFKYGAWLGSCVNSFVRWADGYTSLTEIRARQKKNLEEIKKMVQGTVYFIDCNMLPEANLWDFGRNLIQVGLFTCQGFNDLVRDMRISRNYYDNLCKAKDLGQLAKTINQKIIV